MFEELWINLAIAGGIIAFFLIVIIAACLWEKRPVQPYYVPAVGEEYDLTPDAARSSAEAKALGYQFGGMCHDGKGKLYKVRYDFWLAPDHSTLAVIGGGKVAGIAVNGIWLYSRLSDGRILDTTNEIGEQDISGAEEQQTWAKFGFRALVEKHTLRLTSPVEPFSPDAPLVGFFDIRRRKADALIARGYAHYLDEDRTVWRYTLKGAIVFYFVGTWIRPIRRLLRYIGLVRE